MTLGMRAVILIGHGGVGSDIPRALIRELKGLEAQRRGGSAPMDAREIELDRQIRDWPRSPATDPYKYGLESIADALRTRLGGVELITAYNEFCTPSIDDAIDALAGDGVTEIDLITTMFTPGGNHSENEIPAIVESARKRHPKVALTYVWPYNLDIAAQFLADSISAGRSS
jgi:sirohydrochlorin cobaltochelatase